MMFSEKMRNDLKVGCEVSFSSWQAVETTGRCLLFFIVLPKVAEVSRKFRCSERALKGVEGHERLKPRVLLELDNLIDFSENQTIRR